MKVAVREFNNIYGIPFINNNIYEAIKEYNIVVTVDSIFDDSHELPKDRITIIIDGFAKLRYCGIPILGYTKTNSGVYIKSKMRKSDLVKNTVTVSAPHYMRKSLSSARPSLKLLLMFNECTAEADYKALQDKFKKKLKDPKSPKFKWLRRALNQTLAKDIQEEETPKLSGDPDE